MKYSEEARRLFPYLLPLIQRAAVSAGGGGGGAGGTGSGVPSPHALSSAHHTGAISNAQAPQFLLMDGTRTLTGNLSVNAGITIDGVDLGAFKGLYDIHVADPDAHHNRVTVGAGLTLATQLVAVNQAFGFTWTGMHQFNVDPQINANLDFIGGNRSITASNKLTVAPTGDLLLDPTGLILLPTPQELRTETYNDFVAGIAGLRHFDRGGNYRQLTIGALKADEMYVRVFTADEARVNRGEEFWTRSFGIVETTFVVPADEATVDVWFEEAPGLGNFKLFLPDNWILIRTIDWGTGLIVQRIWFQIVDADGVGVNDWVARQAATTTVGSRQQWRLRRKSGGFTGEAVKAGEVAVDFGKPFSVTTPLPGQGVVHLSALAQDGGPFVQIQTFESVVADVPQFKNRVRMGNLSGTVDYASDIFGFATGNDLGLTPSAGFSGMVADATNGLRLFNSDIDLYDAAVKVVSISRAGGVELVNDSGPYDNDYTSISWRDDLALLTGPSTIMTSYASGAGLTFTIVTDGDTGLGTIALIADGPGSAQSVLSVTSSGIALTGENSVSFSTISAVGTLTAARTLHPTTDLARDLGTASLRWRDIYVGTVHATTISGTTISGAEWEHSASMVIDANAATDTLVSVTNQGAGRADFDVDRNLTLGGTVDGVDVSTLDAAYTAHIANANAHHNQSHVLATGTALGADHTISGAAAGEVLRALSATTAAFDVLQHGDLGGVTANQHHNQAHVLATTSALGPDHTVSGLTAGQVLQATGTTTAIFAALDHANLANITANQHHAQSHALATGTALGADHTISGAAAGEVLRALSATTAAFDVLQHADLGGVTANQHHNQAHGIVSSDHTGTGAILSVVGFSATDTLGVLVPSADVGTTPVASLLKSTSAGGLTLASLVTTGAVDVGEGFTAGATAFRVINHTHDYPHVHVVVNPTGLWSLDEQFGLDIDDNLLVRGWIVGKHAIQIKDAKMLVHYDGPAPVETNFTGNSSGHMGQVGTYVGGITYREGRFGKALQVGEATTNLITNPSFETGMTSWVALGTGSASVNTLRSTVGLQCLEVTNPSGSGGVAYAVGMTISTAYTVSMDILPAALNIAIRVQIYNTVAANTLAELIWTPTVAGWQRQQLTFTTTATHTNYEIRVYSTAALTWYIDAVQLEQINHATPYADGSLATGHFIPVGGSATHTWSGTAHASTSSRTQGYVTYNDPSVLDFDAPMTVMAWVKPANAHSERTIIAKDNPAHTIGWEMTNFNGAFRLRLRNPDVTIAGVALPNDAWSFVAFTYDGATARIYVNGVAGNTAAATQSLKTATNGVYVGNRNSGATGTQFSGLVDELSLIGRVLPEEEIRAIYESNAPVFAETSTWHWRGGRNRIYADAEGLWGYGATSGAIIGLYAGEDNNPSATKSWGGATMSEGDLMIGRYGASNGGWLYFNQDLVGGLPALIWGHADKEVFRFDSGGASIYGVLDIDTAGGIYQGSGTFASPTTGLKIYNSGGIGKLSTYNAGVEQVKIDTDGKLYAGAGSVRMDAGGLTVTSGTVTLANLTLTGAISAPTQFLIGQSSINSDIDAAVLDIDATTINITGFMSLIGGGMYIEQPSTTGAVTVLRLNQLDLSEEFLEFTTTVGAGNPINTTALGAYYGRVRVSVNGTFKWLALYD